MAEVLMADPMKTSEEYVQGWTGRREAIHRGVCRHGGSESVRLSLAGRLAGCRGATAELCRADPIVLDLGPGMADRWRAGRPERRSAFQGRRLADPGL